MSVPCVMIFTVNRTNHKFLLERDFHFLFCLCWIACIKMDRVSGPLTLLYPRIGRTRISIDAIGLMTACNASDLGLPSSENLDVTMRGVRLPPPLAGVYVDRVRMKYSYDQLRFRMDKTSKLIISGSNIGRIFQKGDSSFYFVPSSPFPRSRPSSSCVAPLADRYSFRIEDVEIFPANMSVPKVTELFFKEEIRFVYR